MKVSAKIIGTLAVIILLSACGSDMPAEETIISEVVNEITPDNVETQSDSDSSTDEISSEDVSKLTLTDLLEISNERRHAINQPDISLARELANAYYPGSVDTDVLSDNLLNNLLDNYDGNRIYTLSSTDAISDAQIYFDILRFAYPAYNYFGGDEVFLPVFDEIITELAAREEWGTLRFIDLIYNRLFNLINDHHLVFYRNQFVTTYNYFIWEEAFDKVGDKYQSRDTGLYVTEIVGYDLADIFRLSMNEEGEFYYKPVFAEPSNNAFNITVKYENGDEESIRVSKNNPHNLGIRETELKYEDNIPVITISEMGWPFNDSEKRNEDAMRFLSFADEIRDEDVIIIDIRSNGGGYGYLSNMWLYSLIGDIVPANFINLNINRSYLFADEQMEQIQMKQMEDMQEIENSPYYELLSPFMIREPIGDFHHIYSFHSDRIVSNDKLIILLIDRHTSSAGEIFTDSMFNLENTLVIGQNTAGCIMTGGFEVHMLPESGVQFSLTHRFHLFDETYYHEGIGIAPDVWVSGDALKATLAMLKN